MIRRFQSPTQNFSRGLQAVIDYLMALDRELKRIFSEVLYRVNLTETKTWNPPSLSNGSQTSTTVTVTGAAVGDPAIAGLSSISTAGWFLSANVTSTDTVTVTLMNHTGGTVDLAEGTLTVIVFKG